MASTTTERHKEVNGICYVYRQTVIQKYVGPCEEPGHPHAKPRTKKA